MSTRPVVLLLLFGLLALCCQSPTGPEGSFVLPGTAPAAVTSYSSVTLSGGSQSGHFDDVWDLTAGDITLSFTYDGNGMVDDFGVNAHAWAELGVRSLGTSGASPDFNPNGSITAEKQSLTAGQHIEIGDVLCWISGNTLYVKYEITEPCWTIVEAHLAVADDPDDIPQTRNGNPTPGRFPRYAVVGQWVFEVPLGDGLPANLFIAAHAVVVCGENTETAWAGDQPFPGANWATYFDYAPVQLAGSGIWLATDYDWTPNTFDPDPSGAPSLDLDDKLILQRTGGQGEGAYNLPSVPPAPGSNHRIWWDRDGVDPWQNSETANTGGIYQIIVTLHANDATTGTAYMNIRGLDQGFETDGNWNTIELTPAGMTFVGDIRHLVVFYGLYGYGATHAAEFSEIEVTQ